MFLKLVEKYVSFANLKDSYSGLYRQRGVARLFYHSMRSLILKCRLTVAVGTNNLIVIHTLFLGLMVKWIMVHPCTSVSWNNIQKLSLNIITHVRACAGNGAALTTVFNILSMCWLVSRDRNSTLHTCMGLMSNSISSKQNKTKIDCWERYSILICGGIPLEVNTRLQHSCDILSLI